MVREPDAATRPTPQDNQLMSKHRVLSFKPCLRLEWRGQDGQSEAEQPDHPASLGDSITASYSDEVFGTHKVLDIIAKNDLALASGHLHISETWRVFEEAQKRGVKRMVL